MALHIVRNDITNMKVDIIVNTANPEPIVGAGTDAMIHEKAGPQLLEARRQIGRIRPGCNAVTRAFGLDARYVIHAVGPKWHGGLLGEEQILRACYKNALIRAESLLCRSIAFPLISAGTYGFPREKALNIATQVIGEFLAEHDMDVYLVVFNQEVYKLSESLFRDVASYIDQHYVDEAEAWARRENFRRPRGGLGATEEWREQTGALPPLGEMVMAECAPMPRPSMAPPKKAAAPIARPQSLSQLLMHTDAGFSETLLKLIDKSGKKDSDVYNKANVSRQHFSKIRNNPDYKPTKPTALAFAIALELDMEQTRDLIGRAGYALTRSSKFDVIIMYFIENRNYNLHDINAALYEFDQSLLGA